MPLRTVNVYSLSPGGNTTLLVLSGPGLSGEQQETIAAALLHPLHVGAEQAGFIDPTAAPDPLLTMAGNEFCGNACRSFAVVLALDYGRSRGRLRCSGLSAPVEYEVTPGLSAAPAGSAETGFARHWPLISAIAFEPPGAAASGFAASGQAVSGTDTVRAAPRITKLEPGMALVDLPGIAHLLVARPCPPLERAQAEAAALRRGFGLETRPAVGVIWHEPDAAVPEGRRVTPLVWVRSTDTACLESACGSGTLALALWLLERSPDAARTGEGLFSIRQPSGAVFRAGMRAGKCVVSGPAGVLAKGEAYVSV